MFSLLAPPQDMAFHLLSQQHLGPMQTPLGYFLKSQLKKIELALLVGIILQRSKQKLDLLVSTPSVLMVMHFQMR